MKQPTSEQIGIAAAWLRHNEGGSDEGAACIAIAEWIEHLGHEALIRSVARQAGVTPAVARRKMAERNHSRKGREDAEVEIERHSKNSDLQMERAIRAEREVERLKTDRGRCNGLD